jgi:hypothetical protein
MAAWSADNRSGGKPVYKDGNPTASAMIDAQAGSLGEAARQQHEVLELDVEVRKGGVKRLVDIAEVLTQFERL